MAYTATINTPGYPPDTAPITFDTVEEAWDYLASCRRDDEDNYEDVSEGYSAVVNALESAATRLLDPDDLHLDTDYTGTIVGNTPGGGVYDLGLAYTVALAEDDFPQQGKLIDLGVAALVRNAEDRIVWAHSQTLIGAIGLEPGESALVLKPINSEIGSRMVRSTGGGHAYVVNNDTLLVQVAADGSTYLVAS